MTLPEFCKAHEMPKTVETKVSKNKFYNDWLTKEPSTTPIRWVALGALIPNTDQEVLVCSRGLAEALENGELTIKDAVVSQFSDGTYGLIKPESSISLGTTKLW